MKKILLLIVVLLQVAISRSQTIQYVDDDAPDRDSTEAEALPWFGNNQYLFCFCWSQPIPLLPRRGFQPVDRY